MNKTNQRKVSSFLALSVVLVLASLLVLHISRYQKTLGHLLEENPYQLSDFEYNLSNYDYPKVVEMTKKNEMVDVKAYQDVSQYIAFGHFFEAATYYHMYKGIDAEKTQKYKEQVNTYLSQINSNHFQKHIQTVKQNFLSDLED